MTRVQVTKMLGYFSIMVLVLSGCKSGPDIGIDKIDNTPTPTLEIPKKTTPVSLIAMDGPCMDEEEILSYFYGESRAELQKMGCVEEEIIGENLLSSEYNKNGICVDYTYANEWNKNAFSMIDENSNLGYQYACALEKQFMEDEISNVLLLRYPERKIGILKDESIAACAPLAKACGYTMAQVNVYEMKPEIVKNYNVLNDDKENKNTEEIYEAFLVVYRAVLNDYLLDDSEYHLICVYVPELDKVVYAQGSPPLIVVEMLKETKLISADDAITEVIRILDAFKLKKEISLTGLATVYAPKYDQINEDSDKIVLEPCWRIDYVLSQEMVESNPQLYAEDDGTIFINAIDGKEN